MSSFLAYEAEEKDCDTPEQPERRRVSSALADEAEKEEVGCSGAQAQAEKEAECRHAAEKEPAVVVLCLTVEWGVGVERQDPSYGVVVYARDLRVQALLGGSNSPTSRIPEAVDWIICV